MKKNMGTTDRSLRIVAAVAVAVLYLTGSISGATAIILGIVALVLVVTGVAGFCPGYVPLGVSTRKEPTDAARV